MIGISYIMLTVIFLLVLRDEIEAAMKLCGVTRIDQLHAGYLNTLDVDHLIPRAITERDETFKSRL